MNSMQWLHVQRPTHCGVSRGRSGRWLLSIKSRGQARNGCYCCYRTWILMQGLSFFSASREHGICAMTLSTGRGLHRSSARHDSSRVTGNPSSTSITG
ncbi:hypothetical protein BAE44_0018813 [Dichanthelium oligosanthes]|uniref:Uncharacterized protein n=1 Tax=Dichanthelium oligosanthes TaxID=888268 RepID=A0A1E5V522_9POAL|nr:hypothetical protein BAE44_0018813 [Dichanthelium oligosanthes]